MKQTWIKSWSSLSLIVLWLGIHLFLPLKSDASSYRCVVVLAPSIGDWLNELNFNLDQICGVSDYQKKQAWAKNKASVGSYSRVRIENIIRLKPDLVLATKGGNSESQILSLRKLGLKVVVLDSASKKKIFESIEVLGNLLKLDSKKWIKNFQDRITRIQKLVQKRSQFSSKNDVLIQVGHRPLVVSGGQTFLSHILNEIGVNNVYESKNARYFQPRIESILNKSPNRVFVFLTQETQKKQIKLFWKKLGFEKKQKSILFFEGDSFLRPTLGFLNSLENRMAQI